MSSFLSSFRQKNSSPQHSARQADALTLARRQLKLAVDQQEMAVEDLQTARQTGDERKIREAEEKVQKAEEKVEKAKEEVKEAEEKVQKAEEKVQKAEEKVQKAKEEVQEKAAAQLQCHTSSQFFSAKIDERSAFTFLRIRMAFSIVSDLSIELTVSCRWTGMQQPLPMNWHRSGSQKVWTLACNSSSSTGP